MKKLFLLFIVIFVSDCFYGQPLFNRTILNPGIAGTDSTLNLSLSFYRMFSYHFPGEPKTNRFSADQYVRPLRGGIGFDVIQDKIGNQSSKQIDFTYAPHFELFHHKLAIQSGLTFGYSQTTLRADFVAPDGSSSTTGGGADQSIPWTGEAISNFNIDAGIFMYTKKLYGGIAITNLNQLGLIVNEFTLNAGANLNFKKDTSHKFIFSPNIIFQSQNSYNNVLLGIAAKYRWWTLGANFSNQQEIILSTGIQIKFFKLSYAYDLTTSKLTSASTASHEIHLMWYIPYRFYKPCPIKTIRFI